MLASAAHTLASRTSLTVADPYVLSLTTKQSSPKISYSEALYDVLGYGPKFW